MPDFRDHVIKSAPADVPHIMDLACRDPTHQFLLTFYLLLPSRVSPRLAMPLHRVFSHMNAPRRKPALPNSATPAAPVRIPAREPRPLDATRLSLALLPDAIVRQILGFVRQERPGDVCMVALACSSLYAQARYVQHNDVQVSLDQPGHGIERIGLIQRLDHLPSIRSLRVRGSVDVPTTPNNDDLVARLAAILPALTGLRDLYWDYDSEDQVVPRGGPIPASILSTLAARVCLHTSVSCTDTAPSHKLARESLDRLENNKNLKTLSIHVTFVDEGDCIEITARLRRVLLSCPNLTRLPTVDIWYPRGQCVDYGPTLGSRYRGIGFSGTERPPPLEELNMVDYPWGTKGSPLCQGYPDQGYRHEFQYWAEVFDWSQLVRLGDVGLPLAPSLAPKLTGLRELALDRLAWIEADFLQDVPGPLESLTVDWSRVRHRPSLVARFGATLRNLKLHDSSYGERRSQAANLLTGSDIIDLKHSLPNIETLGVDLGRGGGEDNAWPYEALDAIAQFRKLRLLEIWFPWGDEKDNGTAAPPMLTGTSAVRIFHYLRDRNEAIQRVIIRPGIPTGILCRWVGAHVRLSFVCRMIYPSGASEGRLRIACPELMATFKGRLDMLEKEGERAGVGLRGLLEDGMTLEEWEKCEAWIQEVPDPRPPHRKSLVGKMKLALNRRAGSE